MSEEEGGTVTEDSGTETDDQQTTEQAPKPRPTETVEFWKAKAREQEARAKANSTAAQRLQEIETRDMSELQKAQKAAADADARAKATAAQYGGKLARAHFDALAARRNPDAKTADVLEYVDLTRFVDENGELDEKGLQAAVLRLIPEPSGGAPGFDGGARKSPPAGQDMNQIIRTAVGR